MNLSPTTLIEPNKTYQAEYVLEGSLTSSEAQAITEKLYFDLASQGIRVVSAEASGSKVRVKFSPMPGKLILLEPLIITVIPSIINYITSLLIAAYFITQVSIPQWAWVAIALISGTAALIYFTHKRKRR